MSETRKFRAGTFTPLPETTPVMKRKTGTGCHPEAVTPHGLTAIKAIHVIDLHTKLPVIKDKPESPPVYHTRMLVDNGKRFINLSVRDIIYLKADRDYTWIHTTDKRSYLSSYGISHIERRLHPAQFIRIHRSHIVNVEHIKELHRNLTRLVITLHNGVEISVGRNYQPALKQMIL
jgi:DNA-binding LytR/AlgR family response regulator